MPTLQIDLNEIAPELNGLPESALDVAGRQAVQELRRRISQWPVDTGRSKAGFRANVSGGEVVITNRFDYAYYVERGEPAARTRGSARRTLQRAPARKRIVQAAQRGRISREPAQDEARERRRRERDERIILEGGPDSGLSIEGRRMEARRRLRNRRARRAYRRARALNNRPVTPWTRLTGAEIRVAARLASGLHPDVGLTLDDIVLLRRGRTRSSVLISAALQIAAVL